jgi:5-methylthioadenosine/S-adenosylhomocysteine deaminase
MDDLFKKNQKILITSTLVDNKTVDIFIDETGLIAGIGEGLRKKHKDDADLVMDGAGTIALPGLVNTHTHAAMSLLRGYADDMILQDWLSQKIWPLEAHLTPSDVYWGTKLA